MQPRTLDQIIAELQPSYQPSIDFLRQRQAEIPKTVEADIAAAQAAQTKAYEDILTGARRRGLGFAGIPLGEQAQYASTVFAPAVLSARAKGTEAGQNLEQTILGLQGEMRQNALARRNAELDAAAAARAAAASSGLGYSFGGGGGGGTGSGGGTPTPTGATFDQYKQNVANDIAERFNTAKQTGDYSIIQNYMNSINSQLQKASVTPEVRNRLNYQLSALQQIAQANNIDLTRLQPSRAQAIASNRFVQTAKQTAPFLNPAYAVAQGAKAGYNWLFGRR